MFFLKKFKLEKELMQEIKHYAKVDSFPYDDAKIIGKLLSAYVQGGQRIGLCLMMAVDTLEKYPELFDNWNNLMAKYKKLGLFPKWDTDVY